MIQLSDQEVFEELATGDEFADGGCTECGLRGGMFTVRGRYVVLCPWCAKQRIDLVDLQLGGLPEDVERLRRDVVSEVHLQLRVKAQALQVDRRSVWRCDRCGDRMHRFEVRLVPSDGKANRPGAGGHEKVCYTCYLLRRAGKGGTGGGYPEGTDPFLPANPEGFVP